MKPILLLLGSIGVGGFAVGGFSLFLLWGYFCIRITGHYAGSPEKDAKAKKLAILFAKVFGYSIAYMIALIVVIHLIGPPR
jgi:hypothetical protein